MQKIKVNPKTAALLVIDMQNGFVEPGAVFCIAGAKKTIPALSDVIKTARKEGTKIIWVTRSYDEDMGNMEAARRKFLQERGLKGVLSPKSKGVNSIEDVDGLTREPEDISVVKPRFSAFFKTELDKILRENSIDTLVLTGTTTPNCIRTTAYDGISHDYRVLVVENCCSSMNDEIQRANMQDMKNVGIEIVSGEEISYST